MRSWLAPFTPLYAAGVAFRNLGVERGWEPVRRLRFPVVSIGNLSTGGAGKTPLTIALAKALAQRGIHVDVLSRGYGRRSQLPARVDPLGTAEEFGDEPPLIARETGVPVYVAAQRYQAGLLAEAESSTDPPPAVHLLDDGFQHRQLHRDIDILLLNRREIHGLLDAICETGTRVIVQWHWRPQLNDPDDEMVLETAINGCADAIVTFNRADFIRAARRFGLNVLSPREALEKVDIP